MQDVALTQFQIPGVPHSVAKLFDTLRSEDAEILKTFRP
jgi:hypothetical protein